MFTLIKITKISCRIIYDCIFVKPYMQMAEGGFYPRSTEDEKLPSFQLIISLICFFCLSEYSVWKDSCVDVTGKFPPPLFISNPQGTIHKSCREAAGEGWGGRGGGGKSRKERGCLEASLLKPHRPWLSLPSFAHFAVHRPLSIHQGPPHFHHMIHCPWTMLQAGLVLMSSVVSGDMFKNRHIWFGVSILGLVLSLATQNGWESMVSENQWVSVQEEHWLEVWKDGSCHFLRDPDRVSGPLWSSVYLSVKWTRGGISQDNLQDLAYMVILPLK